ALPAGLLARLLADRARLRQARGGAAAGRGAHPGRPRRRHRRRPRRHHRRRRPRPVRPLRLPAAVSILL
ncbi:MAG: hypothetical protein AVDCRST_MAG73-3847, partial [uncultured Thermomicrobiales bacterium]